MIRAALTTFVTLLAFAQTVPQQPRESASCQSDIVSSTVVATFCGHRQGENEMLDLLILWRGKPGWFQRHHLGGGGGGGRPLRGGDNGRHVAAHEYCVGATTVDG